MVQPSLFLGLFCHEGRLSFGKLQILWSERVVMPNLGLPLSPSNAKLKTEKPAIWRAVAQGDFDGGLPVEAFREAEGGDAVGVEAADVLEVFCGACEVGEVEGLGELAFVGSVEEGGVVDEEAGVLRAGGPGAGEHEVVAEDYHVADGFGAFAVDPVIEGVASAGFGLDDQTAGRIVKGEGVLVEECQFLFQHGAAFGEIPVGFDFEGGAFCFKSDIACLEFAEGVQAAAEVFELSDRLKVALLETGIFLQSSVGLEDTHEAGPTLGEDLDLLFAVCDLFCKALLGFHEEIPPILDEPGVEGLDILQPLADMRGQDNTRLGI